MRAQGLPQVWLPAKTLGLAACSPAVQPAQANCQKPSLVEITVNSWLVYSGQEARNREKGRKKKDKTIQTGNQALGGLGRDDKLLKVEGDGVYAMCYVLVSRVQSGPLYETG